ncbi:PAS domain S-box-containing protein [Nonomuraea maritima]|uniref:protein-serine/threonine phosphatase n=2 Tax=Nonomuraea maritima TaxID=683260 RepID=A0A1G8S871_9ACTN|nr:PAS domain S-box-containing protein [Nonomuraea maritima]
MGNAFPRTWKATWGLRPDLAARPSREPAVGGLSGNDMMGDMVGDGSSAVYMIDAEGVIIGWSPSAEELFGYRAAEVVHRPSGLLLGGDGEAGMRAWLSAYGDDDSWAGITELRHRDGSPIAVRHEGDRFSGGAREGWVMRATPLCDLAELRGSLLESLVGHIPVAMAVWNLDLRLVWLNKAAERLRNVFPHYELGRSLDEPLPGVDVEVPRRAMRRLLADGTPQLDRETRWKAPDGSEARTLSTSVYRLDGLNGRPLGICTMAIDISSSVARDQLAVIREASIRVGTTLDIRKTAQEMADLAVPALADFITVDLAESVLLDEDAQQRPQGDGPRVPVFRRAAVASGRDGLPESVHAVGEPIFVGEDSPVARALATGRPHCEWVLDKSPGNWLAGDRRRARVVMDTGMHSLMVVPLRARGETLGTTLLARHDNPVSFTPDDLVVAEELATRAALSLDNALRYTRERTTALALQRDLLPRNLRGGKGVEVASRYLPSGTRGGVGGDWYDAIPLEDGRTAVVVGDVSGHGINAAAAMGRMRTAIRALASVGMSPEEVLAHLDDHVVRQAQENGVVDGLPITVIGATCVYAVYDPVTRRCVMAAAGHPPPVLVDPSGEARLVDLPSGTPVGLGFGAYQAVELDLAPGSTLALYTDGLIETRERDLDAGMERLRTVLEGCSRPLESACAEVIEGMVGMVGGRPAEDDIALLLARTHA